MKGRRIPVAEPSGESSLLRKGATLYGCRWCYRAFPGADDRAEHEQAVHVYKRREKETVEL